MNRATSLSLLLLLSSSVTAGCLDVETEGSGKPAITAGRFSYCTAAASGDCSEGDYAFVLSLSAEGIEVFDLDGELIAHLDPAVGLLFQTVFSEEVPEGWPPVAIAESIGPSLWSNQIVSRLILATRSLQDSGEGPFAEPAEIGHLEFKRGASRSHLRVELHPPTAGEDPDRHEFAFEHPDGIWPPQRIRVSSTDPLLDGLSYVRFAEELGDPISLSLGSPIMVGSRLATRVPQMPEEFGFTRNLSTVLEDASRDPRVMVYQMANPEWILQSAQVERGELDEAYSMVLLEGCRGLRVVVTYRLTIAPMVVTAPVDDQCRPTGDGLDALDEYRMAGPEALIEIAERLGYEGSPGWVSYHAPDKDFLGPGTADGGRTSLNAKWEAAYRERVDHEGQQFTVYHIFSLSLPGDLSGFHSHEIWPVV